MAALGISTGVSSWSADPTKPPVRIASGEHVLFGP